ncbi:hypothetical protein LOTGIDRAFT_203775 [Lottia gigantea]|uniref:Small integral membrane protein 8 n=1 Tax=Lottia gigantea TaxID=225164 RepID=V4AQ21_LOTGI|nr:hypothetical protein LOTGIDRAFT_203775 [Lottia gigantea]ESO96870.1 hypothetical protein LOTGIDRAFT_203775 [Lottia gigantea]
MKNLDDQQPKKTDVKSTKRSWGGIFEIREPGVSQAKSTSLFRAVNFELYSRPNKVTMSAGAIMFIGCIAYIAYMNITDDKQRSHYNTINLDGSVSSRPRTSKWD